VLSKQEYQKLLRKRIVTDYISEYKKSPSLATIREKEIEYTKKYPNLNLVGFSTFDVKHPNFLEKSSASIENTNRKAMEDDANVISSRIDSLAEKVFDSLTGFNTTVNRCNRLIQSIEARLDNLMLLNSKADIFLYGVQEDFATNEFVDLERSTVSFEPGYVTLGRKSAKSIDLEDTSISFGANSDHGIISSSSTSNISALKRKDGVIWSYYVYTAYKNGRVSCSIEIDLKTQQYVSEIKIAGNAINSNSRMKYIVLYSKDGSTYSIASEESYFVTGLNSVSIGEEGVIKIQVLLIKNAADDTNTSGKENNKYIFSLDSLEITNDKFKEIEEHVLYAGPYEIYDELNRPVNFTQATLKDGTCCIIPEKSSVSFFLSNDNVKWIPASYDSNSYSTVRFSNSNPVGSFGYIDETGVKEDLILSAPENVNLEYSKEALCNIKIVKEYSEELVFQNTVIERNLRQDGVRLYGTQSGWIYDDTDQQYSTVVHIESIEGRRIDLGNRGAKVNGRIVSGVISLPQGYHTFSTSHMNWFSIEEGLKTSELLENADPIHPFNHKLIVEGYKYSSDFSGEKVYNGLGKNFGILMKYVSPELFNSGDLDGDLTVYTVEEYEDELYFKVKIDPQDASYKNEKINVKYMIRNGSSNTLWVKAVIKSNDLSVSPHINSFQVRVV